jgi:hypothetical protein
MWGRLLLGIIIVLAVIAGMYLVNRDVPGDTKQPAPAAKDQVQKEAKNVVMYERLTDSKKTFVIRARTVTQHEGDMYYMESFRMDRSDGMKVEGDHAKYDMKASEMVVTGPMTVITADGWKAELTDVAWNRKSSHALTDKPVRVEGPQGKIRADRAEFFDDFTRLELSGNVHAQVDQKLISDLND